MSAISSSVLGFEKNLGIGEEGGATERGVTKRSKGKTVTYKGYTIQAAPHELIDTGQWGLNLFIWWSTETGNKSRHFYTNDQYATKEEATAHCIIYGQQIIDGKVPGLSVG